MELRIPGAPDMANLQQASRLPEVALAVYVT